MACYIIRYYLYSIYNVPVPVDITVASVTYQVFVGIRLCRVVHARAVVTNVTETIAVRVPLVRIRLFRTVVFVVQHAYN